MISGDSVEYDKLARWTDQLNVMSTDFILTAEIGVREGYGSHVICENIKAPHVHIGIDPYGDIDYKHVDKKKGLVEYWVDEKGEKIQEKNDEQLISNEPMENKNESSENVGEISSSQARKRPWYYIGSLDSDSDSE